jgi:hypothetical protein
MGNSEFECLKLEAGGAILEIHKNISHQKSWRIRFFPYMVVLAALPLIGELTGGEAQVMGEKAEMDRLEVKAEEAMANGDIGRAGLMASVLAKNESNPQTKLVYEGAEDLFRTQENAYRALALFEQAGGQSPAPSGVCQLLSLAEQHGTRATRQLTQANPGSESESRDQYDRLTEKTQEWVQMVEDLQADFSCT